MSLRRNSFGQPIGEPVADWTARPRPPRTAMEGRFVRVEPLDLDRHARELFDANTAAADHRSWTYLPADGFDRFEDYRDWLAKVALGEDPMFHTVVDRASGKAVGVASFMRIDPAGGVIEVGHINFSPALQRKPGATEAMFLMMRRAFDELGYRRYEWKCDSLNGPSRSAAERYGFRFEGIFRQAVVYKGRNRDTAWFSILDSEWPRLRDAFEAWLAPANFDGSGRQQRSLRTLTQA
jgi:RimJ/RimL family protein N-acetyltransferase